MKRDIVIYIDGVKADMYDDTSVTLNFNSSLLSDIGQLKTDGSQTIKLPRTSNNDRIFDMALMPSYESGKTHRYLSCACYVDGVTIFDNGRCHLLNSSGDAYEIAMTWGIMHEYSQWISEKKKLTDLNNYQSDSVVWDATWGNSVWQGGTSQLEDGSDRYSMYALHYNCGVSDKMLANIHPSVTLQEIWERVRRENGLKLNLGAAFADMRNYAVVLKNNNTSLQTLWKSLILQAKSPNIAGDSFASVKKLYLDFNDAECFDVTTSSFIQKGYREVTITLSDIYLSMFSGQTGVGASSFADNTFYLVLKYGNTVKRIPSTSGGVNTIKFHGGTYVINQYEGEEYEGEKIMEIYVELYRWSDDLPQAVWENPNAKYITGVYDGWANYSLRDSLRFIRIYNDSTSLNASSSYSYENNSHDYPLADFRLVPNLPDISQVDFVKFICQFYGLYPVRNGNKIDFVRMDVLGDNIDNGRFIDWSKKLVTAYEDSPQTIAYSLGGFSQKNIIRYKTDENDIVEASASLDVNDATLSAERVMADFPFAASRGDSIPQYSMNDAGEIVKKDLQFRIMRILWNERKSTLNFDDSMQPRQIINRHYQTLRELLRKPKTIEEEMTLTLLDLQTLDYSKPIYLSKYGRFYAIDTIQWSSDKLTSKVKLIQIR